MCEGVIQEHYLSQKSVAIQNLVSYHVHTLQYNKNI